MGLRNPGSSSAEIGKAIERSKKIETKLGGNTPATWSL